MKSTFLLTALAMATAVTAFGEPITISAGPITGGDPPGYQISGSFEGVVDPDGYTNAATGGACMIYQEAKKAVECQSDAECSVGGIGYCAPKKDSKNPAEQSKNRTCWLIPDPDANYCRRRVAFPEKYSLGPFTAFPPGTGEEVSWRVLACQNLQPGGCASLNSQQGVERLYRFGPIRKIKAKRAK